MQVQLGTEKRDIVRMHAPPAVAVAVWWCPFCSCSNQMRLDNVGGITPCGKCGAEVVVPAPEPPPNSMVAGFPETPLAPVSVVEEVAEQEAQPAIPERPTGHGPAPRGKGRRKR